MTVHDSQIATVSHFWLVYRIVKHLALALALTNLVNLVINLAKPSLG